MTQIISKFRPFIFIAGTLISITCLFIAFRKLDWSEFLSQIKAMEGEALLAALVLVNLHNFVMAKRWQLILNSFGKVHFWQAFWSLRISYFFNATLPARLGESFRVFYINRACKLSAGRTIGASGADHLLDFCSLASLLYLSAVVLGIRGTLPPTKTIVGATLTALGILFVLAQLPHQHSKWRWLDSILKLRAKVFEGITSLLQWRVLTPTVPLSLLGWFIEALVIMSFSYGLNEPISIYKAFVVMAGVNLAIAIPSTPGHIGTFELGAVTVLHFFGVPMEQAATIAILYHMVQLIPTLIIGAYGYHVHFLHLPQEKAPVAQPTHFYQDELLLTSEVLKEVLEESPTEKKKQVFH